MKTYLVIGLGRFGSAAAEELFDMGEEVIVLDDQEEVVRQMADQATHAAIGDARESAVLKAAGAMDCDCAIVAIGSDLAASILITMNLKDMGIPYIICKAQNEIYKRALERVGADRVLIPEKEMAVRLVRNLGPASFQDYIEFSDEYGIAEITPPKSWIGKSLRALNIRGKYHVNVLALKDAASEKVNITPGAEDVIREGDTVMIIGHNEDLALLQRS